MAKESPAAMPPTNRVENPDRHQEIVDQRLFNDPIAKKIPPVITIARNKGLPNRNRNGISGTRPQTKNALKVLIAAHHGERASRGKPYSSLSIVCTQRSRSEVINSTTRSRSVSAKPFLAKIWRTSSRSPLGVSSM